MLIVTEFIPTNSSLSTITLINRYLFFTLCQVIVSIICTTLILNIANRTPTNHSLPGWLTRRVLLRYLPNLLKIQRPGLNKSSNLNFTTSLSNYYNPSTTNSTARSSVSGFCRSFAAKFESSQSEIELNSRLVWSRRSDCEEKNEKLNTIHSSTSSSTNSSKRNSHTSEELFEQNELKESTSIQQTARNLDNQPTKSRQFEKTVQNLNFLAYRIQNTEQYLKVFFFLLN